MTTTNEGPARLAEVATVTGTDSETGQEVTRTLPVGRLVWAVLGTHRPNMYGGGVHATVTDLDTGWTGRAIVTPGR